MSTTKTDAANIAAAPQTKKSSSATLEQNKMTFLQCFCQSRGAHPIAPPPSALQNADTAAHSI